MVDKNDDPIIVREVALYLIVAIQMNKVDDIKQVKSVIEGFFEFDNCADSLASIDIGSVFTENEISDIFTSYKLKLSDHGKSSLVSIFLNKTILNEIPIDTNSDIYKYIINKMSIKGLAKKKIHIVAGWYRMTSKFDFSDKFKQELKEIIKNHSSDLTEDETRDFELIKGLLDIKY